MRLARGAKQSGIRFGERAAARMIDLRTDDGRFANVTFDRPLAADVWRPTPPGFLPFFDPWLARMRPLLLKSYRQFRRRPAGADLQALREGVRGGQGARLQDQRAADTGADPDGAVLLRYPGGADAGGLRALVTRHQLDISDSARLFAAVDASAADAIGVSWDSKLKFGFWRPVTAIRLADDDGNPARTADPAWEPLIVTPPYPDYTSGLTTVMGAVSRSLTRVLETRRIDLFLTSALRVRGAAQPRRGRRPRLVGHPLPDRGRGRERDRQEGG